MFRLQTNSETYYGKDENATVSAREGPYELSCGTGSSSEIDVCANGSKFGVHSGLYIGPVRIVKVLDVDDVLSGS
jgi:hypothetical protein